MTNNKDLIKDWSMQNIDPIINDFYESLYKETTLNIMSSGSKTTYRLNPCPICGHNNCATVYT